MSAIPATPATPGPDPTLDRAAALAGRGDLAAARHVLEDALAAAPGRTELRDQLGNLYLRMADWPAARRDLERQAASRSGPEGDYVRGHLGLMFGELPQAWELFERRLDIPGRPLPRRDFPQPRWDGAPFPGRTLLLTWEQGFGDTLQFLRFVPLAKALGGRVLVSVQGPLAALAATCPGVDAVITHEEPLPAFDLHLPLLSLPALFGTSLASLPAEVPYLDVPAAVPNRARIAAALTGSGTRVGLLWQGNRNHPRDRQRSLAAEALAPLARLPGIRWYSFQIEAGPRPPLPGLVDLGPLLSDFSDSAYALSGMDLVICVDTALAHLAGALGIPTLLLVTFVPDWRWLLGRPDSPWYPTMQLLRQPEPGDWPGVIRNLLADLGGCP